MLQLSVMCSGVPQSILQHFNDMDRSRRKDKVLGINKYLLDFWCQS
jgi:hypothetical protein